MEKHDVVIVGAGLGGSRAAKLLAVKDRDVLVLEKDPEEKVGSKVWTGVTGSYVMNMLPKSLSKNLHKRTGICIRPP